MERLIAVLGAGNVGGALGNLWSAKGHRVVYGVRPGSKAPGESASHREAVAASEIVALCVPWAAAEGTVRDAGDFSGKILIDCTNPLKPDLSGLEIGCTTSAGEMVAGWAANAKVVKAFNTIGAPNYGNAQFGSQRADGFYCGDDAASKEIVKGLVEEIDLDPVDIGPLKNARLLESLAMLWIDLAVNQRQGVDHAFKLLRR